MKIIIQSLIVLLFLTSCDNALNQINNNNSELNLELSKLPGIYSNPFSLVLTASKSDIDIYYTTNGENPDKTSAKYEEGIFINNDIDLKVVLYSGDNRSRVVKLPYSIINKVSSVSNSSGKPGAITKTLSYGDYYFVAAGESLKIFKLNDSNFSLVNEMELEELEDIEIKGDRLYISGGDINLVEYDISDPSNLKETRVYKDQHIESVELDDNYAYVQTAFDINIVDLNNFERVSYIGFNTSPRGVSVHGDYMYTLTTHGVRVIDISDKANPEEINYLSPGSYVNDLFLENNFLYVTSTDGLKIYDITNPIEPIDLNNYAPETGYKTLIDIYVENSLAYILGYDSLIILDITDKSNLKLLYKNEIVNRMDNFNSGSDRIPQIYINNGYCFLSMYNKGLQIWDIKDISNISIWDSVDSYPGRILDVTVTGSKVVTVNEDKGLELFNFSNSGAIVRESVIPLSYGQKAIFYNNNLIVEVGGKLNFYNLSFDNSLSLVGETESFHMLEDFSLKNGSAFLNHYSGFTILDISNLNNISQRSSIRIDSENDSFWPNNSAINGDYAYVIAGHSGLIIIDISDLNNPVAVGQIDFDRDNWENIDSRMAIAYKDGYVYITNDTWNTFLVVDVTAPENPTITGSCKFNFYETNEIAINNNRAYLSSEENGVTVIDISNPQAPLFLGELPGDSCGIEIDNGYLYVAGGNDKESLRVYQIER